MARFILSTLLLSLASLSALSLTACGGETIEERPFQSPEGTTQLRLLFQRVDEADEASGMNAALEICAMSEAKQSQVEAYWKRFSTSPRLARRMGHACMLDQLEQGHPARLYLSATASELVEEGDQPASVSALPSPQPERAERWYRRALLATDGDLEYVAAAEIRCDLTRVFEVMGDFDAAFQLAGAQMDARPLPEATQARIERALVRIGSASQGS